MVAATTIARRIAGAIEASPVGAAAHVVVRDAGGRTLYAVGANELVPPASNAKLLTAAAALHRFGPDHTFTTQVAASGSVVGERITGDLFLVGGGDPALDLDGLRSLASSVRAQGIARVDGALVADASLFDPLPWVASWPERFRFDQARAIGPLAITQALDGTRLAIGAVRDPAAHATSVFRELLAREGVEVLQGTRAAGAQVAGARTLATLSSPTLAQVVRYMLKHSNSTTAEGLVKHLGRAASGAGTTAAGSRAVVDALRSMGVDTGRVVVADGSGLSADARVTAALMVDVLDAARRDARSGAAFVDALPVSGVDGTLRGRMRGPDVAGRVHAKTGTLDHTSALSGYVDARGRDALRLSVIVHDPATSLDVRAARRLQDAIGSILAES